MIRDNIQIYIMNEVCQFTVPWTTYNKTPTHSGLTKKIYYPVQQEQRKAGLLTAPTSPLGHNRDSQLQVSPSHENVQRQKDHPPTLLLAKTWGNSPEMFSYDSKLGPTSSSNGKRNKTTAAASQSWVLSVHNGQMWSTNVPTALQHNWLLVL